LLTKTHSVSTETISSNLTIIHGNARDIAPVKETLAPSGKPVSLVISGIGATEAHLQWSLREPFALTDATICADAMTTILSALSELRKEGIFAGAEGKGPLVVAISTTGTDTKTRDVPFAYYGLYHWLLAVPHKDKRRMESALARATTQSAADSPIGGFVIVRPTLLMDGEPRGQKRVKEGSIPHPEAVNRDEKRGKPAIGYTIRRADVGTWIFEECVRKLGDECWNRCVTLTS
jgi:hypothetical protein